MQDENDLREKFKDHPQAQLAMEHNAIWQNTLALRLTTMHFLRELEEVNTFDYYPFIDEVFENVLDLLSNIERESFEICKGVINNVK